MKTNKQKCSRVEVNQLRSLTEAEYKILLRAFDYEVTQELKKKTLQGQKRLRIQKQESKNSSLYGSKKKLSFMLEYMKNNMNQVLIGRMYEISQPKVSQWFKYLLPLLEASLVKLGYCPMYGSDYEHKDEQTGYLAGDVMDRILPRKVCYKAQKEDSSGKHHRHTEKNFGLCDSNGYIHFMSDSYTGSTHDKTIFDELNIETNHTSLLLDLGFLGVDENIITPFKKPKNRELSITKKQLDKAISSLRVIIENAFSGIKRLKMIKKSELDAIEKGL